MDVLKYIGCCGFVEQKSRLGCFGPHNLPDLIKDPEIKVYFLSEEPEFDNEWDKRTYNNLRNAMEGATLINP